MKNYMPRLVDHMLENKLKGKGAVLIQGPKWCGKTTTAEQFGAWLNGQTALDRGDIVDVEAVRAEIDPPYPGVRDGGEPYAPQTNYYGDAREQFAQWFGSL